MEMKRMSTIIEIADDDDRPNPNKNTENHDPIICRICYDGMYPFYLYNLYRNSEMR